MLARRYFTVVTPSLVKCETNLPRGGPSRTRGFVSTPVRETPTLSGVESVLWGRASPSPKRGGWVQRETGTRTRGTAKPVHLGRSDTQGVRRTRSRPREGRGGPETIRRTLSGLSRRVPETSGPGPPRLSVRPPVSSRVPSLRGAVVDGDDSFEDRVSLLVLTSLGSY